MILLNPKYDFRKCCAHLSLLRVEVYSVFQKNYFDFLLKDETIITVTKNSATKFLDFQLTNNWFKMFPNVNMTCELETVIAHGNSCKYIREVLYFSLEGNKKTTKEEIQTTQNIVSEVNKFFDEMNRIS